MTEEFMELREPNLFEQAVAEGGAGLVGVDGSGNDWEFPQHIGNVVVEEEHES